MRFAWISLRLVWFEITAAEHGLTEDLAMWKPLERGRKTRTQSKTWTDQKISFYLLLLLHLVQSFGSSGGIIKTHGNISFEVFIGVSAFQIFFSFKAMSFSPIYVQRRLSSLLCLFDKTLRNCEDSVSWGQHNTRNVSQKYDLFVASHRKWNFER